MMFEPNVNGTWYNKRIGEFFFVDSGFYRYSRWRNLSETHELSRFHNDDSTSNTYLFPKELS